MTNNQPQHDRRPEAFATPTIVGGRNLVPDPDIVASDARYFVPIVRRAIRVGQVSGGLVRWLRCRLRSIQECTAPATIDDALIDRLALELAHLIRLRRSEPTADGQRKSVLNAINATIFDAHVADSTSSRNTQIQFGEKAQFRAVRETILVTEDEPSVLTLIRFILDRRGYNVLYASKGTEAIRVANDFDGPIELLVTDVFMPEMNGVQLARQLTAHRPDIKVLFLSGSIDEIIDLHETYLSEFACLQKPFTPAILLNKVHEVLTGLP